MRVKNIALIFMLFVFILCQVGNLWADDGHKVLILVLDTSKSMAHKEGDEKTTIMEDVKLAIKELIDELNIGDIMYLITFDEEVIKYEPVRITDENSKEILKDYITKIRATGKWTYTAEAIRKLFEKARESENLHPNYSIQIVVMTDGVDDPPPSKKNDRLNINLVAGYKGSKWFIYYVVLDRLDDNLLPILKNVVKDEERLKIYTKKRKQEIKQITREITREMKKSHPTKTKNKIKVKPVSKKEKENKGITYILLAGVGFIVIFLLAGFVIYRHLSEKRLRIYGVLSYWKKDIDFSKKTDVELHTYAKNRITIGRELGVDIRIPDLNVFAPLIMVAKYRSFWSFYKEYKILLETKQDIFLEYINQQVPSEISYNDSFRYANYIFILKR